jgi:hypothetical protein
LGPCSFYVNNLRWLLTWIYWVSCRWYMEILHLIQTKRRSDKMVTRAFLYLSCANKCQNFDASWWLGSWFCCLSKRHFEIDISISLWICFILFDSLTSWIFICKFCANRWNCLKYSCRFYVELLSIWWWNLDYSSNISSWKFPITYDCLYG